MRTHLRRKLIGATLAALALTALGTVPAGAHAAAGGRGDIPAITEEASVTPLVVPRPTYDPDPNAVDGPRQCLLQDHEYNPTPGCGGFMVHTILYNVQAQPGYLDNAPDETAFVAYADTARTFGCSTATGAFDWKSAFVVREKHRALDPVFATAEAGYLVSDLRSGTPNNGPEFYVNFAPVTFTCPAGETKAQYGLKVSNVSVSIADSPVYGTHTWRHPGPYYG